MNESTQKLKELVEEMRSLALDETHNGDIEWQHVEADNILCKALEELGQNELVKLFYKVSKWYA